MSDIKIEKGLQPGICMDHGGVLLFWCINCRKWLCNDCTIEAHRNDACAFLPWKRAAENFHKQTEEHVRRLGLKLDQNKSLVEKCQAWEAASSELLAMVQTLRENLQERQESMETLFEEGNETLSQLKAQLETKLGKSLVVDTSDAIHLCKKGQDFEPRAKEFLGYGDLPKEVSEVITVIDRLDVRSYTSHLLGVDKTMSLAEIGNLMVKDPKFKQKGFLLRVQGVFCLERVLNTLGKNFIEHVEQAGQSLYIVSTRTAEERNFIVSKIKSFSFPYISNSYSIHPITPIKVRVKGILYSTPNCMSTHTSPNINQIISTALPVLKNVRFEFDKWDRTEINNGHLQITCEADDLNELDHMLNTKLSKNSMGERFYEIPVGSGTKKLGRLEAGPLHNNLSLQKNARNEIPVVTGWKW